MVFNPAVRVAFASQQEYIPVGALKYGNDSYYVGRSMYSVVFEFNEVPTQMGLKGTAIEGTVGIAFIMFILVFFLCLSFLRHIRIRRQLRVRLDPVEGTVNNIRPPPPAYDSLHAGSGRRYFWLWSQQRNELGTPDPSNTAIERIRDPFIFDNSPPNSPTSEESILPPYCQADPHGLPSYESIVCADMEDRLLGARSTLATHVPGRTRGDACSRLAARERQGETVVLGGETSPSEA
ncbi:uncharacterized protein Z519_06207 [Cladophialophora bantiana CBS 173.52]|uniref:Uncharacterized protein n=1 Tax=Cladophialophora bantiana (strain ATCC 10958 / CBS 173.52 / CDC B-1940 / NIH 8579) TaxID=1442370 RepID=A0A0D2G4P6_CLAB1|nr:uncharacterized protein Z519_06207 [Cladophialophora bantiana CBS 173.52]KIW93602.1 hypothetical protein Z519_06207 [Cladophialophora bantiana CBS 173.52]